MFVCVVGKYLCVIIWIPFVEFAYETPCVWLCCDSSLVIVDVEFVHTSLTCKAYVACAVVDDDVT